MRIALDTNILLYAHQAPSPTDHPTLARLKSQSRALLGAPPTPMSFLVPAPALGEWLSDYEQEERALMLQEIQSWATIIPYDAKVAAVVGGLWRKRKAMIRPKDRSWACIKVDLEIFACALAWGLDGLCSADADMQSYGQIFAPHVAIGGPDIFL